MPPRLRPHLLAFDIDSTLVTQELELKPEIIQALRNCNASGMQVAYLTNRRPRMVDEVADAVGVPALVATSSGCLSWEYPGWRSLDVRALPERIVELGLEALMPWSVACYVHRPGGDLDFMLYERRPTRYTAAFLAHYGAYSQVITDPSEMRGADVYKLAVVGESEVVEPLRAGLPAELLSATYCYSHVLRLIDSPSLELNHPAANKGDALARFAQQLGIERERVLAVGDGENDIPMLSWAGHGVSMPCASSIVRSSANEQLEGDGSHALAELLAGLPELPDSQGLLAE